MRQLLLGFLMGLVIPGFVGCGGTAEPEPAEWTAPENPPPPDPVWDDPKDEDGGY